MFCTTEKSLPFYHKILTNFNEQWIQATIFASKAPLSIIFIATENNCGDMKRLGLSAGQISYQNRRAERDMLQVYSKYLYFSVLNYCIFA